MTPGDSLCMNEEEANNQNVTLRMDDDRESLKEITLRSQDPKRHTTRWFTTCLKHAGGTRQHHEAFTPSDMHGEDRKRICMWSYASYLDSPWYCTRKEISRLSA